MADLLLIDTDVVIDYLRGRVEAVAYVEALTEPVLMSVITQAELFAGVREGSERSQLETFVSVFELVDVDPEIARVGGLLRRDYGKSHNVGLPDALIAATARTRGATLMTLNSKHFPMLDDVVIPYQRSS
jgi:predicted nucleic acid-binding protein